MAVYNVKSVTYGAVGNGVTDDTAAVSKAAASLNASTYGGELYFPAGIYKLTNIISLTGASSKPVTVRGDHMHGSQLYFTAATKGLIFTGKGNGFDGVTVKDLTLSTNGNGGIAINVLGTAVANPVQWKPTLIENVRVRGDTSASAGYFLTGVQLFNSGLSIVRNLVYEGSRHAPYTNDNYYDGTGIVIDATHTLAAGTSIVDVNLSRCYWGIQIIRNVDGVTIRGGAVTNARYGIYAERQLASSFESWLAVSDFRIVAAVDCIRVGDQAGLNVHNCFLGKVPDADLTLSAAALRAFGWNGIACNDWEHAHITNNIFSAPNDESVAGRGTQRGIYMGPGNRAVISGNHFDGGTAGAQPMEYGVRLEVSASGAKVTHNVFRNVTIPVSDNNGFNVVV